MEEFFELLDKCREDFTAGKLTEAVLKERTARAQELNDEMGAHMMEPFYMYADQLKERAKAKSKMKSRFGKKN